jgi:hypothetical protein
LPLLLQAEDFRFFALDVKNTISIFRKLESFVDKEKYCLRGIETYLVPGIQQKELSQRRLAIVAFLIEAEDQFYFDEDDPEKIRMALEPASRNSARVAFSRAATDAVIVRRSVASTEKFRSIQPRRQSLLGRSGYIRRLSWIVEPLSLYVLNRYPSCCWKPSAANISDA